MGEGLFEYAVFRDSISYLDTILSMLPERVTWKLPNILRGNCEKDLVQTPAVSLSVCTAVQIGLVDLLASWGVRPSGVAGHSSGEMAAAYASGRITAAEAITVAYYRGYVVSLNKHKGAMLAVGFGTERAVEYIRQAGLEGQVRVAAINSVDSVTISGDAEPVEELSAKLTREAVFNRLVRTGGLAYHSHHMLPLGSEYEEKVNAGMRRLKELGVDTECKVSGCSLGFLCHTRQKYISSVSILLEGQFGVPGSLHRCRLEVARRAGPEYWCFN